MLVGHINVSFQVFFLCNFLVRDPREKGVHLPIRSFFIRHSLNYQWLISMKFSGQSLHQ